MTSTVEQEMARENAVLPALKAVEVAVKEWARTSTDGARVWEAAGEILPDLWHDWRMCLSTNSWAAMTVNLRAILVDLAAVCADAGVSRAAAQAQQAIQDYAD